MDAHNIRHKCIATAGTQTISPGCSVSGTRVCHLNRPRVVVSFTRARNAIGHGIGVELHQSLAQILPGPNRQVPTSTCAGVVPRAVECYGPNATPPWRQEIDDVLQERRSSIRRGPRAGTTSRGNERKTTRPCWSGQSWIGEPCDLVASRQLIRAARRRS